MTEGNGKEMLGDGTRGHHKFIIPEENEEDDDVTSPSHESNNSPDAVTKKVHSFRVRPEDSPIEAPAHTQECVERYLQAKTDHSPFFGSNPAPTVPFLELDEIALGHVLGQGEFGRVCEIIQIMDKAGRDSTKLLLKEAQQFGSSTFIASATEHTSCGSFSLEFEKEEEELRARKVLQKRVWKDGKARYAAKQLKMDLANHLELANLLGEDQKNNMGVVGAMDLAFEGRLLASLSHPNIVKLRATAGLPGQIGYTLLLDRLHTTLDAKITQWQGRHSQKTSKAKKLRKIISSGSLSRGKATKPDDSRRQLLHRLYAAYDIARALRYLHEHEIVFRDLKPQNVGFDLRDDVKLFDFGLAKEFLYDDMVSSLGSFPALYNATGMTGSLRWMSPEVYFSKPYGLSADVYSFGLLLWNLCYLETPFGQKLSPKALHDKVMMNEKRPKRSSKQTAVSDSLWNIMVMCWSKKPIERPDFEIICEVLRKEMASLREGLQASLTIDVVASGTGSSNPERIPKLVSVPDTKKSTTKPKSFSKLASSVFPTKRKDLAPVDMSCHYNRPNQQGKSAGWRKQSSAHPQEHEDMTSSTDRFSILSRRTDYLDRRSINSVANLTLSSRELGRPSVDAGNNSRHSIGMDTVIEQECQENAQ